MTKDDIIRMAVEAGFAFDTLGGTYTTGSLNKNLEAFANLVAAHEREACAKLVDDIEARCVAKDVDDPPLNHVAAAIRERGQP